MEDISNKAHEDELNKAHEEIHESPREMIRVPKIKNEEENGAKE